MHQKKIYKEVVEVTINIYLSWTGVEITTTQVSNWISSQFLFYLLNMIASLPCWQFPMQKLLYLVSISRKVEKTLVVCVIHSTYSNCLLRTLLLLSYFVLTRCPYTDVSNGIYQMEERKNFTTVYPFLEAVGS